MEGHAGLPQRRIPLERAVAWKPLDDSYHLLVTLLDVAATNPVVFVGQRLLAQLPARMERQPALWGAGILAGGMFRCPRTGLEFCVVEEAVPAPGESPSPGAVTSRVREQVERVRGEGQQPLGWFTGRPAPGTRLRAADERLHAECFPEPWQVALVLSPGAASGGAVFRFSRKAERSFAVPFHELLESDGDRREARKPGVADPKGTVVAWENYVAAEPVRPLTDEERRPFQIQWDDEPVISPPAARAPGMWARLRAWIDGETAGT